MHRRSGNTLAVPEAALQRGADVPTLGFDGASWRHLQACFALVQQLPDDVGSDAEGLRSAVEKLRLAVGRFGSPAQLRELLNATPEALAGASPPSAGYAGIVWWANGLHASASSVVSILQEAAGCNKEQLQLLGAIAGKARNRIAPVIDSLHGLAAPLIAAGLGLSEACQRAGRMLQHSQEGVGVLHERVSAMERQLAELGLFGAHRKQDLLANLHLLQKERAVAMARAGRLQAQLGALDAVLDEGAWLEPALADAVEAMEKLRTAWTRFGSAITQLVADASTAQLSDAAWTEQTLERAEAIRQWTLLECAARGFAADVLADCGAGHAT